MARISAMLTSGSRLFALKIETRSSFIAPRFLGFIGGMRSPSSNGSRL